MSSNSNVCCASCLGALRSGDEIISCTHANCDKRYHKDTICIGGSAPRLDELVSWMCPYCKSKTKRGGDNSSTPVKGPTHSPDMNITVRPKKTLPSTDLQALTSEIRLLREEVSSFNAKLENVSSAMHSLNEQMEHLVARVTISDERILQLEDRHTLETELLKTHVQKLEEQLNTQAQAYLRNEIEMIGIPECSNENLQHIALVAAKKLGVDLKEQDIDWVLRTGIKKTPISSSDTTTNLPRPVVMRLLRRSKRDEFLKGVKTRKNITTKDLGIDEQLRRVYFNERLTRENRQFFRECRNRAATAGYKFCWSSNGSIFLRRREGSPAIRVRRIEDLQERLRTTSDRAD